MCKDEDCGNCGMVVEVEKFEDGECEHCGCTYCWEEYYDEDEDTTNTMIIWKI